MAKKKRAASNHDSASGQGESISGYFRKVFAENPHWLDTRSNDQLFLRWLKDHPGETVVPERVRQNLSNVKSVLRKQARKKPGRPKKTTQPATAAVGTAAGPLTSLEGLNTLELQIDDCLTLARTMDRDALADIISLLRRARFEVVWKMGETIDR